MKTKLTPDAKFFATLWILTIVVMFGGAANFHAVATNEGRMPVQFPTQDTDRHFQFSEKSEVNNYYLTDIIKIPYFYVSIGDIVMFVAWLSMLGVIFSYARKEHRQ